VAGTVTFRGVAAEVQSWTDTQVVAVAPAGVKTGAVRVVTGGVSSNAVTFTVP
jgi:uncharacterized protein (TIGR03437 family)